MVKVKKKPQKKEPNKFIDSGFFEEFVDEERGLRGLAFVPHFYPTLEEAKEGAQKLLYVSSSSILFFKRHDGQFTFVPIAGDARTMMFRVAKACGAEQVDDFFCFTI
jgi:hypothetical protein